jgi:hypothetical protein
MPRPRVLALALLALVIPLGIAACGGDDDGGGSDDTAKIIAAIETSVFSTDPADCTRLQTQRFLEQSEYEVGQEAVQSCEEDAADTSDQPDSVDVTDVQVDGDNATAAVAFQGGPIGTATVDLALVREGDQWKLDQITGVRDIDLESFKQAFSEEIEASPDIPAPIANCIKTAIGGVTEDQVKDAIVDGSREALLGLFGNCIPNA